MILSPSKIETLGQACCWMILGNMPKRLIQNSLTLRRPFVCGILGLAGAWTCGGAFAAAAAGATMPSPPIQSADRTAPVTKTAAVITVDGLLDEPAWAAAPKIGEMIQREPRTSEAPSERTEVTLLHDNENLYIGVVAYDSEPDKVIGTLMERDAKIASDDRIELLLDTYRDRRNAFYFATNPSGALVDGLVIANKELNTDWDAIWDVRTRRTDQGWVAEFAIPFKSLSFPASRTVWGFNISRTIQRKSEEDRWSGARLQTQLLQVSEAGEITGLAGLSTLARKFGDIFRRPWKGIFHGSGSCGAALEGLGA